MTSDVRSDDAQRDRAVDEVLAAVVRQQWGRIVAALLARYRRLDLVEDALADAVEAAARTWPRSAVPAEPAAWLTTTAKNRILDRLRAEAMALRKAPLLITEVERADRGVRVATGAEVEDDLLRLVLMVTHPAVDPAAASALALRLVLGVSTADIARLFLVPTPTMAARITRAKRKITTAGIPFGVPSTEVLPARLGGVAQTAYLAFTAGYAPGSGPDVLRVELAGEAIRLVRVVLGLAPQNPTLIALLALMLYQHSRRDARVGPDGALVLLPDQDRGRWHHQEVAEASALLQEPALRGPIPVQAAAYLVQARIAAAHATAARAADTDWEQIVHHYDLLLQLQPGPAAALGRAVAVAEARGPDAGLLALGSVPDELGHRLPAVRAELLARAGRLDEADVAGAIALSRCDNEAESALLRERLERWRVARPPV